VTLRAPYATLSPEFDNFLFAQIGEEGNGMSLSVLSAFTRLDIDPWREAARLSALSKDKAVEALAPIIARLPVGRWTAVDIPAIARRLVEFLPRHDVVLQSVATLRVRGKGRLRAAYAIFLILMMVVYFGFVARHQAPSGGDATHPVISDTPH
jgi:hypothetical protein